MQIIKGKKQSPPRIVIYGQDKIGKSTFAAQADSPLFLPTEEGVDELGPDRFPLLTSSEAILHALKEAGQSKDHRTVVLDNLSGTEDMIHAEIAKKAGVRSIAEIEYGKGYAQAHGVWERIIAGLDYCRDQGKAVIIIGHSQVRRAEDPDTVPYDQWTLDLHKGASALFRRWADVIAYAAQKVTIDEEKAAFGEKIRRAVSHGDKRVLHLTGSPSHVAGNRYGLPASCALSWQAFVASFPKQQANNTEQK